MNCGRTAAKIMKALGFETPTTKPCRSACHRVRGIDVPRRTDTMNPRRCRIACTPRKTRYAAPGELQHREDHDRLLHDHTETQRDEHDDDEQAERVADDGQQ